MSFTLVAERRIPEIDSTARLYSHDGTGARVLSLENRDENKVFGATFRTPPTKSDGVAHIMEHSVLCGSEKYPVREPFVELMKGSLNTFLNAMTYPDKTVYPVASANLQDFRNLVDVYLDAVFHPLISEDTLRQEGWHYETDPDTGALSYKGVVFNEMKGAYSDPDDLHGDLSRRSLFPDTAYGLDSGGDPEIIPSLDYGTFKAFHDTYYHPSNSFIYFYGDDDPAERLALLDERLASYGRIRVDSLPEPQPRFAGPRRIDAVYDAAGADDPKVWLAINWALAGHGDPLASMGFSILSHILTATPASPLRKALIESGLGEDLAGFGYTEELRTTAYSVGLKGISGGDADRVEALILDTLARLADGGIDPDTVTASMNTVEFALREKNTGRFPRGLAMMMDALNEWLYDGDPFAGLAFEAPFAELKKRVAGGGRYFEGLIRGMLLENPHRTTLILKPDAEEGKRRAAREAKALETAAAAMDAAAKAGVAETARRLKERQETPDSPEALDTIPSLALKDLPAKTAIFPNEILKLGKAPLLFHDLPTSSILYFDIAFDMKRLDARLLPYAGLIGRAMLEMGTDSEDFVRLSQRIGRDTGGIRTANFTATLFGLAESRAKLFVRAKTLASKAGLLFGLLGDVLLRARFDDKERFRQIVLEEKAQAESSVVPAGHRLVGLRLRSRLVESDWAAERMGGLERLFFLRALAKRIDGDWKGVLADLEATRSALIDRDSAIFNATIDAGAFAALLPGIESFAASLPRTEPMPSSWTTEANADISRIAGDAAATEGLAAPSQVNFVGKVFPLRAAWGSSRGAGNRGAPATEGKGAAGGAAADAPAAEKSAGATAGEQAAGEPAAAAAGKSAAAGEAAWMVVNKYLDTSYLWEKVRVQGGAYGGFSSFDLNSGLYLFLSYRDPNLLPTLGVFDGAASFLKKLDIHPDELRKSIIGTIGDIDAYLLPDAKGFSSLIHWLTGYDVATRQAVRERVLGASKEDFARLGAALASAAPLARAAALASEEALGEAFREGKPGWSPTKVM